MRTVQYAGRDDDRNDGRDDGRKKGCDCDYTIEPCGNIGHELTCALSPDFNDGWLFYESGVYVHPDNHELIYVLADDYILPLSLIPTERVPGELMALSEARSLCPYAASDPPTEAEPSEAKLSQFTTN
jgi:hypothetical protein